jgi:hypothetical protein
MTAHAGMGVEFLTIDQGERELIRSYVEARHKEDMRRIIGVKKEK